MLVGEDHCLRPVPEVELGEDPGDVRLDRLLGEEEPIGDLAVGQA